MTTMQVEANSLSAIDLLVVPNWLNLRSYSIQKGISYTELYIFIVEVRFWLEFI